MLRSAPCHTSRISESQPETSVVSATHHTARIVIALLRGIHKSVLRGVFVEKHLVASFSPRKHSTDIQSVKSLSSPILSVNSISTQVSGEVAALAGCFWGAFSLLFTLLVYPIVARPRDNKLIGVYDMLFRRNLNTWHCVIGRNDWAELCTPYASYPHCSVSPAGTVADGTDPGVSPSFHVLGGERQSKRTGESTHLSTINLRSLPSRTLYTRATWHSLVRVAEIVY